ncbi:MAG: lysophospholipid acyltransferase family protein [Aerococcus sp.]|nr:lysophospholipid acyltransferase family protein [Aerococcus sp.]
MWGYRLVTWLLKYFIFPVFNGKQQVIIDPEFDPNKQYVIIAPHRSWMDPMMISVHFRYPGIRFLAKQELFNNRLIGYLLENAAGAIPVDRDNPGRKPMKTMTNELRKGQCHIGIFPTGSRYSTEIKSGAATVAKLGNVDLLPVAYQGPLTFRGIFSRRPSHRIKVGIGKPIHLPDKKRLNDEDIKMIDQQIANAFEQLDHQIDPTYHYDVEAARAKRDAKKQKR